MGIGESRRGRLWSVLLIVGLVALSGCRGFGPSPGDPTGPTPTDPAGPTPTDPAGPTPTDPAGPTPTDPAGPTPTDPAGPTPGGGVNPGCRLGAETEHEVRTWAPPHVPIVQHSFQTTFCWDSNRNVRIESTTATASSECTAIGSHVSGMTVVNRTMWLEHPAPNVKVARCYLEIKYTLNGVNKWQAYELQNTHSYKYENGRVIQVSCRGLVEQGWGTCDTFDQGTL